MARIKIQDYIRDVESCRQRLINHARENDINVNDNISLADITNINTQSIDTSFNKIDKITPIFESDPAVDGPFDIIWIDLDGTELFKETVNKGEAATQFTGEPNLHKVYPNLISWNGWEYNGSLDNVYRDVVVYPKYEIVPDTDGNIHRNFYIVNVDIDTLATYSATISHQYYSVSSWTKLYDKAYIDWGDGSEPIITGNEKSVSHTYTKSGTYIIELKNLHNRVNNSSYNFYIYNLNFSNTINTFINSETAYNVTYVWKNLCNYINIPNYTNLTAPAIYSNKLKVFCNNYIYLNTSISSTNSDYITTYKYIIQKPTAANGFYYRTVFTNADGLIISIAETATSINLQTNMSDSWAYKQATGYIKKLYIPNNSMSITLNIHIDKLTIPENITSFSAAHAAIRQVKFLGENTKLSVEGFKYNKILEYVNIPSINTTLPNTIFYECSSLKCINLPSTTTLIGSRAFYGCYSLKYINLDFVQSIEEGAFYNCSSLNADLSNLKKIGNEAFRGCNNLHNIYLTAHSIGRYAFYGCGFLDKVWLSEGLTILETNTFFNATISEIHFPSSLELIDIDALPNTIHTIDLSNTSVSTINGSLNAKSSIAYLKLPDMISTFTGECHYITDISNTKLRAFTFKNSIQEVIKLPKVENFTLERINGTCLKILDFNDTKIITTGQILNNYNYNITTLTIPNNSQLHGNTFNCFAALQSLDLTNQTITSTLNFSSCYSLKALILPNDYKYNLNIYYTSILNENLHALINSLVDNSDSINALVLTINSEQQKYLANNGLLDVLNSKNWTISISNYKS